MAFFLGEDYIVLIMTENTAVGFDLATGASSATAVGIGNSSAPFTGIKKLSEVTTPASDDNRVPNLEAVEYDPSFEDDERIIDGVPQSIPIRKVGSVSITFTAENENMLALLEKARFGVDGDGTTNSLHTGLSKYNVANIGYRVVVMHKDGTKGLVFYHCIVPKDGFKSSPQAGKAVAQTVKFQTNMWAYKAIAEMGDQANLSV